MAQREYSDYQKKVISKYYDRLDVLMLQKLQELVSELYLADTDAKQNRLWERVHKAMLNLNLPSALVEHIIGKKDVEILARNLQDWLRQNRKD
jgi:intergrase/recombinase